MHIDWKTGGQTYAPYLRMFSFQIKIFLESCPWNIYFIIFVRKRKKKISLSKLGNTKKQNKPFQAGSYKKKEKKCKKGEFGKIIMRRIQSYEEKRFFFWSVQLCKSYIYVL